MTTSGPLNTTLPSQFDFPQGWLQEPNSPNGVFGTVANPDVGREVELSNIWSRILRLNAEMPFVDSKAPAAFIHASPGVGKTFLFKLLMAKNTKDIPEAANDIQFMAVDFNSQCCE